RAAGAWRWCASPRPARARPPSSSRPARGAPPFVAHERCQHHGRPDPARSGRVWLRLHPGSRYPNPETLAAPERAQPRVGPGSGWPPWRTPASAQWPIPSTATARHAEHRPLEASRTGHGDLVPEGAGASAAPRRKVLDTRPAFRGDGVVVDAPVNVERTGGEAG